MVISNIGTIVISLPSSSSPSSSSIPSIMSYSSTASSTATQVRLLSLSNTFSRLLVGPIADFVSPIASYLHDGSIRYDRKHRISRVAFLSGATVLLVLTYSWMEIGIHSREALWALRFVLFFWYKGAIFSSTINSIGTGVAYGTIFTALPGVISAVWGLPNLGRNFGVITYAPFVGTPLFSYLYAFSLQKYQTHIFHDSYACKYFPPSPMPFFDSWIIFFTL